jgi:hypothetical protein
VFVLTVCNPSAPEDGDSFDDKSFKEKSIPNLFIEGNELSSQFRIFRGWNHMLPESASNSTISSYMSLFSSAGSSLRVFSGLFHSL